MMESEILRAVVNAGVGGAISALIIFLVYKLMSRLSMDIGMKMVRAFEAQAEALSAQARSMEGLTKSIQDFVSRDNSEHREMLVLLRFIAQEQQKLEEVRIEHNQRKEQAHPHCPVKPS